MKLYRYALLSTTLLSTLLLSGCGSQRTDIQTTQQPHEKSNRAVKDWTWEVDAKITINKNGASIKTFYYDNIPNKIKHYQVFIDCIANKGFNGSDGWEVYGADYLVEDTSLYKSLSNSEWKWEYLGEVTRYDNKKSGDARAITIQNNPILAAAIKRDIVNIYIEPYDANWVGEYYTIPLPDVLVTKTATNIDEAFMKAYVKEHYAHAGVLGVTKYSTYHKIAAVSVTYHSPSYIDVYNFQNNPTPQRTRIRMNQNGLVDYNSIDIVGEVGSEEIVFRMTTREDSPTISLVHYDLKNKKVKSITVLSGGVKEILKQRLGKSYHSFSLSPNAENAIVTTRDDEKRRTYSLYDVRDAKNPTLTHHLVTEQRAGQTRWFNILDNTFAEYTTIDVLNGSLRRVRLDYIHNKEVPQ